MDYTGLIDQYVGYFPEFRCIDPTSIETAIKRALLYINASLYGEFYYEALFIQTSIFLYSSDLIKNNSSGFETSRSVSGEYSVSYSNKVTSDGKLINPYEQQLKDLNNRLGLGFGMILEL